VIAGQRTRLWAAAKDADRPIPALLVFVALWGLFLLVLHPWLMNWGATPDEQTMALPGDAAPPAAYFTRAITIDAPPTAVWSWLQAIGQDRAGFLSNDWLENLAGADIHNADVLRPEWQPRAVGDRIPMTGELERRLAGDVTLLTVRLVEPERVLADAPGRFVLLPRGDGGTRLLLREALGGPEQSGLSWVVWDPMHFVMEQRMLRGIKERAEGQPLVPPVLQTAGRLGWALVGLILSGVFLAGRAWRPWLLLPLGVAVPPLAVTGDLNSTLAGFLAVGITVAGALAFGWRWWPPYILVASAVALMLLLAPDPYTAFGLVFLGVGAIVLGAVRSSGRPVAARAA
jgi:hypothetical protein